MTSFRKRGFVLFVLAMCFVAASFSKQMLAQDGGPLKLVQPAEVDAKSGAMAVGSPGVLAGETLYVSGQSGRNADGSVPADFKQEVAQSLHGVQSVLRAAGMDYGNIAWLTVYVTDAADIAPMNEVYWKTIGSNPPARTILRVSALPNGERVEINCIAAKDTATRRAVWPAGWKRGPNVDPPAIAVKDVYYLSAQSGAYPLTGKVPEDSGTEIKQALENVKTILQTANMTMANVVWVNPYVLDKSAPLPPGVAPGTTLGTAAATPREAVAPRRAAAAGAADPAIATALTGGILMGGIRGAGQRGAGGGGGNGNSMNSIYATYFEFGHTPGRGTIMVAGLPDNENIVFSVIAGSDITKRKDIQTFNMAPSPTASPGCMYRDTYYMSGKSGFIPDQGVVTQDIALQARQTMRNLQDDLQAAGMTWADNVFATIYMREIKDTETEYGIYKMFFKTPPLPPQTTLQQSMDMRTTTGEQITLIAVRQPKP